jgi:sugar phosphate isomerase/epimerase
MWRQGGAAQLRLGATSFVYRDHVVPNVERLAARVDDIEILIFDVDEDLPAPADVARLVALKQEHRLSYTVHTPLDASLASADETRRQRGVDKVRRALDWARPLAPHGHPLHVYLGEREHDPEPPRDLDAWRERARRSLATLIADGHEPRALCLELIDYDFELIHPVVQALDLGVALDVGHLQRDGKALDVALDRYLSRTRIIQWHGTEPGGRDHKSLRHLPQNAAEQLIRRLIRDRWPGVLTLEVFAEADFEESLEMVDRLVNL